MDRLLVLCYFAESVDRIITVLVPVAWIKIYVIPRDVQVSRLLFPWRLLTVTDLNLRTIVFKVRLNFIIDPFLRINRYTVLCIKHSNRIQCQYLLRYGARFCYRYIALFAILCQHQYKASGFIRLLLYWLFDVKTCRQTYIPYSEYLLEIFPTWYILLERISIFKYFCRKISRLIKWYKRRIYKNFDLFNNLINETSIFLYTPLCSLFSPRFDLSRIRQHSIWALFLIGRKNSACFLALLGTTRSRTRTSSSERVSHVFLSFFSIRNRQGARRKVNRTVIYHNRLLTFDSTRLTEPIWIRTGK